MTADLSRKGGDTLASALLLIVEAGDWRRRWGYPFHHPTNAFNIFATRSS